MMGVLRAIMRLAVFVPWTVILVVLQLLYTAWGVLCGNRITRQSPVIRLWYAGVVRILNITILLSDHSGRQRDRQYLYLANHSSYLDIMVLGACIPPFFVAKSDTADWPVAGFLIKLGGTLFISRRRSALKAQMDQLRAALNAGKHLLIFPEGTTSDGLHILPFKSSLMNIVYDDPGLDVDVAPVAVAYTKVNGAPFGETNHEIVAWYRDMAFGPHIWQLFQQTSITAHVTLLPVIHPAHHAHAKDLTAACHDAIKQDFAMHCPGFRGKLPE